MGKDKLIVSDLSGESSTWGFLNEDESLEFTSKVAAVVDEWMPNSAWPNQWSRSAPFQLSHLPTSVTESKHPMFQLGASQNGSFSGSKVSIDENRKTKDRKYRERCKDEKRKMEFNLRRLTDENSDLKVANTDMKHEKDSMYQNLQSAAAEIKKLKGEVSKLKGSICHQQILVEAFSNKIVSTNYVNDQIKQLREEIAGLSPHSIWKAEMTEKNLLVNKIMVLKYQNKVLRVQVQALCEMISNEKNREEQ